jgi:hypothetical protein
MAGMGGAVGGKVQLRFLGTAGQSYVIQASTNLLDWVTLTTCTADGLGNVTATDPDAHKYPARFYRVAEK